VAYRNRQPVMRPPSQPLTTAGFIHSLAAPALLLTKPPTETEALSASAFVPHAVKNKPASRPGKRKPSRQILSKVPSSGSRLVNGDGVVVHA
jgi:hypothetical protein